jgi:hypothetical protein
MYAFLLGNCGTRGDAPLLGRLARSAAAQGKSNDGLLAGYVLLNPREGWGYVRELLDNPAQPFPTRLSALHVAGFFCVIRPGVIARKEVVAAVNPSLDQPDIADLAMNYLGAWRCWALTDRILAVPGSPAHNTPLIRRAVLRYALRCPGARAAAFVVEWRQTEPRLVEDTEATLREEAKSPPPPPSVVR